MYKDAYIDGDYRYWLSRYWDDDKNVVAWIMLNPSTADHKEDDPTIRRCINFAKFWGFGGIMVVNLFALRATDPKELKEHSDPVGPKNDYYLRTATGHCKIVVAAWGNNGLYKNRDKEVIKIFPDLTCLKKSIGGNPCHPLYLKGSLSPIKFQET